MGINDYVGSIVTSFTIVPKNIEDPTVSIDAIPEKNYTGSAIEPTPNIIDTDRSASLVKGTDYMGMIFYRDLFSSLKLNVREYTFNGHDEVVAYSLSIPFASTLVFGSIMKHQEVPGTTFKKHLAIAHGLLSEDDYLLTEILFNPNTNGQLQGIIDKLNELKGIVEHKDSAAMKEFLDGVRERVK